MDKKKKEKVKKETKTEEVKKPEKEEPKPEKSKERSNEEQKEVNNVIACVTAVMYIMHKNHMITNRQVKSMLKTIDVDKKPLEILKYLKDVAGTVSA